MMRRLEICKAANPAAVAKIDAEQGTNLFAKVNN